MRLHKTPQLVEAVMFFTDEKIFKQLLLTEFEAVLDGVVNMPEFVDQQVRAAYVLINTRLLVRSLVFFYIDFDVDGAADSGWNIPLRYLAERAEWGPDLGAGPIRLASHSQCPEPSYQMHLWEPDLSEDKNHVLMVRDAVQANALGLLFDEPHEPLVVEQLKVAAEDAWRTTAQVDADEQIAEQQRNQRQRQKAAQVIRKQRVRISDLMASHEQQLTQVRLQGEQQLTEQQQKATELQDLVLQQKKLNGQLKRQLSSQEEELVALRAELQQQILSVAQREHALNKQQAVALAEHQQHRARAELAVAQQSERVQQLATELALLKQQLQGQQAKPSSEHVLQSLTQLGVVFVANHPGAGHITIPLRDMESYQQQPMAYVAKKCAVSEKQYLRWLAHYKKPICTVSFSKERLCGVPIAQEYQPSRFVEGDTDRCAKHKRT